MALFFVFLLLGLGYLSNHYSKVQCERLTGLWLGRGFEDASRIYVANWESDVVPHAVLSSNAVIDQVSTNAVPVGVPVLELGAARMSIPFVVRVEWSWSTHPTRGASGSSWYACLFGVPIEIGNVTTRSY
jgi:hypothetical protein